MQIIITDKASKKKYIGTELIYKSYDKYGYVLLDDRVVYTHHPVYVPDELHEYFKLKHDVVYLDDVPKKKVRK